MNSFGGLFTSLALFIVLAAIIGYALYWVLRTAIRDGIRDAHKPPKNYLPTEPRDR